ncbi:glycosyltransferase family 2 protein [Enterobacter sp. 22466]|uniref:glycosyltransferase family 2 protein n=1 Tax=Enterobacter sp. 22466 TaxID=3453924 RepID=UPI003F836B87
MRALSPVLAIVIPCYNEEDVFPSCKNILLDCLSGLISVNKISAESYLLFVDDGSHDLTWQLIEQSSLKEKSVKGLKLSANKGHQTALLAGMQHAESDILITIDADLQDDVGVIEKMVDAWHDGADVVYGVRNDRHSDSFFKRKSAALYYRLMTFLGVKQIPDHADFRLLSARAVSSLLSYHEHNLYLRGLVPQLGFPSCRIFYRRNARVAGEAKYTLLPMLKLAVEGITSFSVTPLRIIAATGALTIMISVLTILYVLAQKVLGNTISGWTSLMLSIFFLGGIQMLCLGVLGEYIGKIYMECKSRPKYFIENKAPAMEGSDTHEQ